MIQSFKMALRSISAGKMRAALTMLGIIIGVMALVVLVSLVNGATSSVTDKVSALGSRSRPPSPTTRAAPSPWTP